MTVKYKTWSILSLAWLWLVAGSLKATDLAETRKLAEQGDAWYQTLLGTMYHQGEQVPRDYGQALRWYRLAAQQGSSQAQANLGVMYAEGQGVEQDYASAADWFLKAAERGNKLAQHNLGLLYGRGQGVPRDYVEAYIWESLAASSGHQEARRNRDLLAARLSEGELETAQRRESFRYLKIESRKSSR